MKRRELSRSRRGMSMLELLMASSMLAMVLSTVGVLLRTGRMAWEAHAADYTRIEAAHATVRHIVRQVRQAAAVESVSPASDASGRLALRMQDGAVVVWDHDASTGTVHYGIDAPDDFLADTIASLQFTAYQADGVTVATDPRQVRALLVEVTVQLPVEFRGTRTVRSWAWIRSW